MPRATAGAASRADASRPARRARQGGLTILELVAVLAIMLCVAMVALPLGANAARRWKELQLRRALTTMCAAIDEYHRYAEPLGFGSIKPWDPDWEGYPKDLEMLVDGVEVTDPKSPNPKKVVFLRAIPVDPMTGESTWGFRSYQDDPTSSSWGEQNLYDVYSLSEGTALDGSMYSDWGCPNNSERGQWIPGSAPRGWR